MPDIGKLPNAPAVTCGDVTLTYEQFHKLSNRVARGLAAKGVKFGRPPIPLPDNFYPVHKAWRAKKLTLKQAAAACGMPMGTFYSKAVKFENTT